MRFCALLTLAPAFAFVPHLRLPSPIVGKGDGAAVIILPGYDVAASRYVPVAEALQDQFASRNVSLTAYVVQHCMPFMSHFETESRVRDILKNEPHKKVFIVGHSQGAFAGIKASETFSLPLVQVAGSMFGKRASEVSTPLLTVLFEKDERFSCLRTVSRYKDYQQTIKNAMVTVPAAGHFFGMEKKRCDADAKVLSHVISDFAFANCYEDERAGEKLLFRVLKTNVDYASFIHEKRVTAIGDWAQRRQLDLKPQQSFPIIHSPSSSLATALLITAFPWASLPLYAYYFLPKFVFSHPTDTEFHVFAPQHTYSNVGTLLCDHFPELNAWVKLKHEETNASAKYLNEQTFKEALSKLTDEQREAFDKKGKKVVFKDDLEIPHVPFCSLIWIHMPMMVREKANEIVIRSPVLKTRASKPGKYGGRLNAKLLSLSRALELLLK